jgi:hypothetical protein
MGRTTTLKEEYFSWLYGLVKNKRISYEKLCRELHEKKFRWSVHNDDNRCEDGINLRDQFIEDKKIDESHLEVRYFLKGDCTTFEVLVALAQRINDLMFDLNRQEDRCPRWFMEMITNLGLNRYSDDYCTDDRFPPVAEARIDEILEILMDRTYDQNGNGSLFPIKRRHPKDMSTVEIWYQLMLYLDENYGH